MDLKGLMELYEKSNRDPWFKSANWNISRNASFIIAIHEALPALLDRLEAAEKVVEAVRILLKEHDSYCVEIRGDWSGFDGRDLLRTWRTHSEPTEKVLSAFDAMKKETPEG